MPIRETRGVRASACCLPGPRNLPNLPVRLVPRQGSAVHRSEEHTSELQSRLHLVCRLLLEKKKNKPRRQRRCIVVGDERRDLHPELLEATLDGAGRGSARDDRAGKPLQTDLLRLVQAHWL